MKTSETDRLDGQVNEIVGESGTRTGEGCLMTVVAGAAAALLLTAVGILVAGPAGAVVPRKPTCIKTVMPNVVGMTATDAVEVLYDKGFSVHINLVKGEVDLFHVASTLPVAGTLVGSCTTVEIWRGR